MAPRRAPMRALLGGLIATVIVLLAGIWLGGHPSDLPSPLRAPFFEARRAEPVTEQALGILTTRYYRQLSRSELTDHGLSAMVASLDDPYSRYLDPATNRATSREPQQEMVGVGIQAVHEPDGLRVAGVFDGSPAAHAGVKRADLIIKIDSVSLADKPEAYGFQALRGSAGTRVALTIRRGGSELEVSVVRERFATPVASGRMLSYHDVPIGYLRLTGFSEGSADALRAQVQAVLHAHARALILDLRGNGGGLIDQAIDIASIFIAHGKVMSADERGQPTRVYTVRGGAIAPQVPMVVLVDHGTASSSEILTAALQDLGRAKVVGTQTYGKAVFQQTQPLNNGGALDITIGQYFTPDGRSIAGEGIAPNVEAVDDPRSPTDPVLAMGEKTVAAEVH